MNKFSDGENKKVIAIVTMVIGAILLALLIWVMFTFFSPPEPGEFEPQPQRTVIYGQNGTELDNKPMDPAGFGVETPTSEGDGSQ